MSPYQTCSSRTKHPFVRPGDEKVTADLAETEIFHAKRVDSVDAEDHAVRLGSRCIELVERLSHLGNR